MAQQEPLVPFLLFTDGTEDQYSCCPAIDCGTCVRVVAAVFVLFPGEENETDDQIVNQKRGCNVACSHARE